MSAEQYPECPECGYGCEAESGDTYKCWTETCRVSTVDEDGDVRGRYDPDLDADELTAVKRCERELQGTDYYIVPYDAVSVQGGI